MEYLGTLTLKETLQPAIIFNDTVEYFCCKTFNPKVASLINKMVTGYNLYITIDKQIEVGQPYFTSDGRIFFWDEKIHEVCKKIFRHFVFPKPIVMSTDVDLIANKASQLIDLEYVMFYIDKLNDSGKPIDYVNLKIDKLTREEKFKIENLITSETIIEHKNYDIVDEKLISVLLSKFEKIKGYASNLFDNEEWNEFHYFVIGYKLHTQESTSISEKGCPFDEPINYSWDNKAKKSD